MRCPSVTILLILLICCPFIALAEGEATETPAQQQTQIDPNNVNKMSTQDIKDNIDQIKNNPALIARLEGKQIGDAGYTFWEQQGMLDKFDVFQVEDSGIYESPGADLSKFNAEVRSELESSKTGQPGTKVEGNGKITGSDSPDGRVFTGASSLATETLTANGIEGTSTLGTNELGQPILKVDSAESISIPQTIPAVVINEQKPSEKSKETDNTDSPPNTEANPDNKITKPELSGETHGDQAQLQTDPDKPQPKTKKPTSTTASGTSGFEFNPPLVRADSADSIIITREGGSIEISNNVNNFESNDTSFKVGKAQTVSIDGVTITGPENTEFQMIDVIVDEDISRVLDEELFNSQGTLREAVKIRPDNEGTYNVTTKEGTTLQYQAMDNSSLIISLDDENPYILLTNGILNITPDTSVNEPYKEQIDAKDGIAQAIVSKTFGVLYLKLIPPGVYRYLPESIEKTFALKADKQTQELYFSKGGRERLKNNCKQCTMVDLVEKTIKINGMLDYLRFFFRDKNNLLDPNMQPIFTQSSELYAILEYDSDLRFIDHLAIRNNTGEFIVRPTNWLQLRYEGTQSNNGQGEVYAGLDDTLQPGETSGTIIKAITNPGNTALREVDDPLSNKKVLAQGSVFYYEKRHKGILPFIVHLEKTAQECVFS